jgi:hypothetical protein
VDEHRAPVRALVGELAQETLNLDGRLFRTLKLLPQPGRLTQRFLAGQRASFLSPVRLYLLASVALFSSVLTLNAPAIDRINLYIAGELMNGPHDTSRTTLTIAPPEDTFGLMIARRYGQRLEQLKRMPPQQMLDRLFAGLRSVLPISLILFVPFLALALKLLYVRSGVLYIDHLIFSVHFQAALFGTLVVTWLVTSLLPLPFVGVVVAYAAVFLLMLFWYLPIALRRVYGQGRAITAIKTLLLALIYLQLGVNVVGLGVVPVLLTL